MALKGNLRDFNITQLLNLINLARKSGTLVVEGPNEKAWITFREGKLAYTKIGQEDNSLASVLHRSKKISVAQYRVLKGRASEISDKELGLLLINAGYVTQENVIECLQQYSIQVVRKLFTWMEGIFHFENDVLPPNDRITIRLDLENLIIEGARQLKEQEQLQDEIPTLDMALKFTDRPGTNIKNISLSVDEWRVVAYINPKNSIKQIARVTKLNDLEIRRIVYSLLQAGLVEIIRPESVPPPVATRAFPTSDKTEQKSLVNRLIARIRSL